MVDNGSTKPRTHHRARRAAAPPDCHRDTFVLAAGLPLEALLAKGLRGGGHRNPYIFAGGTFAAPRRVSGLIVAFNLTRGPGFPPGGDAEPRSGLRVEPATALHSALTPMTPHERDPCVGRSEADDTLGRIGRG